MPDRASQKFATLLTFDAEKVRKVDPVIDRILCYFEAKTGGHRLAKRQDFRPSEMQDLLPDICLFEPVYAPDGTVDDVFIRLQGTRTVTYYGENTGKSVRLPESPEVGARIIAAIQVAVDARKAIEAESSSIARAKDAYLAKALYVPMAEDGEKIDLFFVLIRVVRRSIDDMTKDKDWDHPAFTVQTHTNKTEP